MIYLDNAATSFPKPPCVSDEICKCIKNYCGNPGRSSHYLSLQSAEKIYETRTLLADMFGAEPERVIFTYNTTYALNIAIKSALIYSSHVLISDIEHNSVFRPIYELSRNKLCTFNTFSTDGNDEKILDNIKKSIKQNTKMIVCTHSSNICSRQLPIEKIGKLCKEKGIYFIVDGAQSAGVYNINVKKMCIDALCLPAHKSLYGPQGVGIIIFGNDRLGKSVIEGGTGINSLEQTMPDILPERYEAGTLSTPSIAGLCAALKWLKSHNWEKFRAYEESLCCSLLKRLEQNEKVLVYKGSNKPGNTVMFNVKGLSPTKLNDELNKRHILTRSGLHCSPLAHKTIKGNYEGAVRASFGIYNTNSDIQSLADAIEDIIIENKK